MARAVTWSEEALRDVDEIAGYVARGSKTYASTFVRRLFRAAEGVTLFPEAGAMIPDYERHDLRETFVGSYRLIYRIEPDEVIVLAVVHGARDLQRAWRPPNE